MHTAESQVPGVPGHIEECDGPGPALRGVHPVPCPRIGYCVALAAIPDIKTVKRVIENGQPDAEQLQSHDKGEAA